MLILLTLSRNSSQIARQENATTILCITLCLPQVSTPDVSDMKTQYNMEMAIIEKKVANVQSECFGDIQGGITDRVAQRIINSEQWVEQRIADSKQWVEQRIADSEHRVEQRVAQRIADSKQSIEQSILERVELHNLSR
ncbi:hypothetical protein BDN70DRAFT_675222 [Pholiota conissans]|uniref:Uncharacterized protein n=1 Tax=Pholiota conissans TaxID=109636 RepID=A0A9P5ZCW4_9AGAR|nr:hypothetical protein BDN70DRAFT_675222 [Pholiota conissans]